MAVTTNKPASSWLSRIETKAGKRPNVVVLHAVEGFGKTSFAAQVPGVVFGMSKGETGLLTLVDSGRLPEVPYFPEWESWTDVMDSLDELLNQPHDFKCLAPDTINGLESLCHEHVCETRYGGDWSSRGFTNFQEGYTTSLEPWRELLAKLDALRTRRGMTILLPAHTRVVNFKNPEAADYDRFVPDMHAKTWGLTHKFADMVLFGNYTTVVATDSKTAKKGKAKGGQERVLYTERTAAFDAKNRHGLAPEIDLGNTPGRAFEDFKNAMKEAKANGQPNT